MGGKYVDGWLMVGVAAPRSWVGTTPQSSPVLGSSGASAAQGITRTWNISRVPWRENEQVGLVGLVMAPVSGLKQAVKNDGELWLIVRLRS